MCPIYFETAIHETHEACTYIGENSRKYHFFSVGEEQIFQNYNVPSVFPFQSVKFQENNFRMRYE